MKNILITASLFCYFIIFGNALFAQKLVKASGTATVRMEESMTPNDTHQKAQQLAMINAIENAFGTYVEQQTDMTISDGKTDFNIIGQTKVKGEWVETIGKPEFTSYIKEENTRYGKQPVTYIRCNIKGKVRKIRPNAQLQYEILNAPDLHARATDFYDEEQVYVYFKSPVKGYLSIFLEDDDAIYRLLPYKAMNDTYASGIPIKSDTDYILFSPDQNAFPGNPVDEIILYSNKKYIEYNYIYIVFSEEKYAKPMLANSSLDEKDRIIPKQLTQKNFRQWLAKNRAASESFQTIMVKISIEQKN